MEALSVELYSCIATAMICVVLIARRDETDASMDRTASPITWVSQLFLAREAQ